MRTLGGNSQQWPCEEGGQLSQAAQESPFRFAASRVFHQFLQSGYATSSFTSPSLRPSQAPPFPCSLFVSFLRPPASCGGLTSLPVDVLCHIENRRERGQRTSEKAVSRITAAEECREVTTAHTEAQTLSSFCFPFAKSVTVDDSSTAALSTCEVNRYETCPTTTGVKRQRQNWDGNETARAGTLPSCETAEEEQVLFGGTSRPGQQTGRQPRKARAQEGALSLRDVNAATTTTSAVADLSLSSRVADNESLLDDLLGFTALASTAAAMPLANALQPQRREETTVQESVEAVHHSAPPTSVFSAVPPPLSAPCDRQAFSAQLSVKELKKQCRSQGLLECGTKAELLQRLERYAREAWHPPPQQSGTAGMPEEAVAAKRTVGPSLGSPSAPVAALRAHSSQADRTPSPDPTCASSAAAAVPAGRVTARASPPRTIFRLISRSPCATTDRTREEDGQDEATTEAQTRDESRKERERHQLAQRTAPSPTAFAERFRANQKAKRGKAGTAKLHAGLAHADADAALTWQLLVDNRERVQGSHEKMLDCLRKARAPCVSATLPCGDFMISVNATAATKAAPGAGQSSNSGNGHSCGGDGSGGDWVPLREANNSVIDDNNIDSSKPTSTTNPFFPGLLSVVIERKTLADLDSSIKGSRYVEQRRLLAQSPFARVLWLVEGASAVPPALLSSSAPVAAGRGKGGRSREMELTMAQLHTRVTSACASLSTHDGFAVVRTRNTQESAAFLAHLAVALTASLAASRSRHACAADDGRSGIPTALQAAQSPLNAVLPTLQTLQTTLLLQKRLRAATALPRMLMCIRGCSAKLACFLVRKYGSLYNLWRTLQTEDGAGPEALDADPDIQRLSLAQKKVVVLLSEFVMAAEYY